MALNGWVLEDVKPVDPPIPHRGAQGFWEVDPDKAEQLMERLGG